MIFKEKKFSCYPSLTDQISLSDYLYFLRYWAISVLQSFVSQVLTSNILKLVSLIPPFFYITEKPRQKMNILKTKWAFKVKQKTFFINFKGLPLAKNYLRLESLLLKVLKKQGKKAGTNFFYCPRRYNKAGWTKTYLPRPIKVMQFLTRARFKFFKLTWRYFSTFNNTPPASWVEYFFALTTDFLTCLC